MEGNSSLGTFQGPPKRPRELGSQYNEEMSSITFSVVLENIKLMLK
jgi:hypothetical protein